MKQKIVAMRGRNIVNGKRKDYLNAPTIQRLEVNENDESNCLTGVQKDNLVVIQKTEGYCTTVKDNETGTLQSGGANVMDKVPNILIKSATKEGFELAQEGDSINLSMPNSKTRRGRVGIGVAQTLDTQANQSVLLQGNIRRLTEIECERLQGYPDNWTEYGIYEKQVWINKKEKTFEIVFKKHKIPRTQRYKLCGNAVTKDIVELIGKKLLKK